jgi:hypothetical protein
MKNAKENNNRTAHLKRAVASKTILLLLALAAISDLAAQSGVYVGGHIRRQRPETITRLKASGFQYLILFNVHVEPDGSLTTDGDTICRDGQYIFEKKHPYYISDVKALKTPPTSIERIEICIGGWTNTSYKNIKQLVNDEGTGENTAMYRNFKILKETIPEIDAVNNDDEHTYDVNSAVAFHLMMDELGYKTTLAPYTNKFYWTSLVNGINLERDNVVERILIQCYEGGAGNNPSDWHIAGIPLHAGREDFQDFQETQAKMNEWKTSKNVTGGFFWIYNYETWNLNKYATTLNRIFGAPKTTDTPAATFYETFRYGGYAVSLPEGEFHTADMAAYGITDNDISSLKINPGYEVTVYDGDNFSGSAYVFNSDIDNMRNKGNKTTSSIRIVKKPDTGFTLENEEPLSRLYPNPAAHYLYLETKEKATFHCCDLSGKIRLSGNLQDGTNRISIENLPDGLYLIHIRGIHSNDVRKLSVKTGKK